MKELKKLLFIFIIMIFISTINVDAASVSVKSVKLIDSTGKVTEVSEPKPNGLNIKFDLSFANLGDTAKYEVVLNNPTNHEYEINTEKKFSGSNYISYSYELKDKTNRIKANSEVVLYITVKYENPVPADKLVDGKYVENNDMGITLLNENNPNTFNNILWIILILLVLTGITVVLVKTKNRSLSIIVIALLLVPVTVFALEKLTLTVSTKITVEEKYDVYYLYSDTIKSDEVDNYSNIYDCSNEKLKIENNGNIIEYSYCLMVEKGNTAYRPGDIVNIEKKESHMFDGRLCDYNDQEGIYNCPFTELPLEDNLICNYSCGEEKYYVSLNQYLSTEWKRQFSKMEISGLWKPPQYLNICTQEEFNNMRFGETEFVQWYSDLANYGDLYFYAPNSFTMPRHDVYYSCYID